MSERHFRLLERHHMVDERRRLMRRLRRADPFEIARLNKPTR